ncbi:hypothetical protein [Streptomyces litchfieldiae]|uniref:Uncharacterized protein n=1 Tax=Streptomyces litchfieldiae TaxID=3075543 RepID=A0ABU2N1L4_9ACTN|nr:hypothetical protein [Streptomyces sp. DSM 44938]MDT0347641.1 hypothetical protein [Streptomyces sp. DSM 44938]
MDDNVTKCRICGEFVLQIPGWTTFIPSYWLLRATWDPDHQFLAGALHFSCLKQWKHRDAFLREATDILIGRGRTITVEAEGTEHVLEQPGVFFSERIFRDAECAIYRNTSTDRWLVLSEDGPWIVLDRQQLSFLGRGRPARAEEGGERVALPDDPGPAIETATLPELLVFLGSRSRYPALEHGAPDYQRWRFVPRKRVLEYSVGIDLSLPASATEFLAGYSHDYEAFSFDAETR